RSAWVQLEDKCNKSIALWDEGLKVDHALGSDVLVSLSRRDLDIKGASNLDPFGALDVGNFEYVPFDLQGPGPFLISRLWPNQYGWRLLPLLPLLSLLPLLRVLVRTSHR